MKLAIVGSRAYPAMWAVRYAFKGLPDDTEVISGEAQGVDREAKRLALNAGFPYRGLPADWKTYGRAAGPIRNSALVESCDVLIAFWDGESRGTKDAINKAKASGKCRAVFGPNGERRSDWEGAARL